ncbi:universal stress protein [Niveispirillum fermenti]|uniref:universal stress protein n=1 Tax=Niveispirillum fermenti TaxID=1233113 RepID=UPI003A87F073
MAYRKITCFVTGGARDAAALSAALTLAAPAKGNVTALYLKADPRDVMPMVGEGLSGALIQDLLKSLEQENQVHAAKAHATLEQALAAVGGAVCDRPPGTDRVSASFAEAAGVTEDVMAAAARLSDITVFPSVANEDRTAVLVGLEAALLESGRPVLVAPEGGVTPVLGRTVALAWNGRAQSARALALAMPLLEKADAVHVLGVDTLRTDADEAAPVVEYLAWHGIPATYHKLDGSGSVAAQLQERCAEVGADLLVMGGYGHSRLRELILGGVTRAMLNQTTLPLLLAH